MLYNWWNVAHLLCTNVWSIVPIGKLLFIPSSVHLRGSVCLIASRDFNVLRKYLPAKYEYVIKIYMGDLQKQLYSKYLELQNIDPTGAYEGEVFSLRHTFAHLPSAGFNTAKLFADYQYLMKIWTVRRIGDEWQSGKWIRFIQHPWLLRPHFMDRWKKQQKKDANELEKIDPFFNDINGLSDEDEDENTVLEDETSKKKLSASKRSPAKTVKNKRLSPPFWPMIFVSEKGRYSPSSSPTRGKRW